MSRTPGSAKTGGRQRGSLDKGARTLVTAQMSADILDVYNLLGGPAFLYRWARDNPSAFVNGPLARLMPAPSKPDDEAGAPPINVNISSDLDAAMRIAYALEKGLRAKREQQPPVIEDEPDS